MSAILQRARFRLDHVWARAHMSDHLEAELSSSRRDRMERHLGECVECRRVIAGLGALLSRLQDLPRPATEADAAQLSASVRRRLGDPPQR
jgi:predicted anti-sigma-YlaC factor YlaD